MATLSPIRTQKSPILWGLFAVLCLWNYWPTWKWIIARWEEAESYMSHGWLIVPISAYLLWQVRGKLGPREQAGWTPLLLFGLALFLHFLSGVADVSSISGFTMVLAIFAFFWMVEGWKRTQIAWFAIFFLVFMIPPPEFVISGINFRLKLVAADIAALLLNVTGLGAIRAGSFMIFGEQRLAIGDVCSGLRSLLSLMALGVLYAYLIRDKGWKHVVAILIATAPAAILGNGIRIGLVCYLVHGFGPEKVFKPIVGDWDLHLITGGIIFGSALACLLSVSWLMDKLTVKKLAIPRQDIPA